MIQVVSVMVTKSCIFWREDSEQQSVDGRCVRVHSQLGTSNFMTNVSATVPHLDTKHFAATPQLEETGQSAEHLAMHDTCLGSQRAGRKYTKKDNTTK